MGALELLRVPLDPQTEGSFGVVGLDGFDHAVGCTRRDAQTSPRAGHGLMVEAVHGGGCVAQDRLQAGARLELEAVAAFGLRHLVRARPGKIERQVSVEATAPLQGQKLHAVADGQHRHAALEGAPEQRLVESPLRRCHRCETHRRRVGPVRRKVVATRKQEAVHRVQQGLGRGRPGEQEREPACLHHGTRVGHVQVVLLPSRADAAPGVQARRDAHAGSHAGSVPRPRAGGRKVPRMCDPPLSARPVPGGAAAAGGGQSMTIQVGDRIPSVTLKVVTPEGFEDRSTDQLFGGRKVVLFALPGAFTPTCSAEHLPGFVKQAEALRAKGVDEVLCLSVNDPFVMDAWGKGQQAGDRVTLVADGNAEFTRAVGLDMDASKAAMGVRSQRYALVAEDGVVKHLAVDAPMKFEVSSAEAVLEAL